MRVMHGPSTTRTGAACESCTAVRAALLGVVSQLGRLVRHHDSAARARTLPHTTHVRPPMTNAMNGGVLGPGAFGEPVSRRPGRRRDRLRSLRRFLRLCRQADRGRKHPQRR